MGSRCTTWFNWHFDLISKGLKARILMETAEFKKIVDEIGISNGMQKRGSYYYLESKEKMVVLGLQKSSYSSSYYFNLGYIIKDFK
jgi:hypothetical protein